MLIDDLSGNGMTSRLKAREHLDEQLNAPFVIDDDEPVTILEGKTRAELDRERMDALRLHWGHDEAAQRQWH